MKEVWVALKDNYVLAVAATKGLAQDFCEKEAYRELNWNVSAYNNTTYLAAPYSVTKKDFIGG